MTSHTLTLAARQTGKSRFSSLATLGAMASGARVLWVAPGLTHLLPSLSSIISYLSTEEERVILETLESSAQTATERELTELEENIGMLTAAFNSLDEELSDLVSAFAELARAIMDELEQENYDMARAGSFNIEPWLTVPEDKTYDVEDLRMITAGRF